MKINILAFCLFFSCLLHAKTKTEISFSSKVKILSLLVGSEKIKGNTQIHLKKILEGQSYDFRVSITDFKCLKLNISTVKCTISYSTDDLTDDDRGWSSSYEIKVEVDIENWKLKKVSAETIAG